MNQKIRNHFEMAEYWSEESGFHHFSLAEDIVDYYDLRLNDHRIEWHNGYAWEPDGREFIESEIGYLLDRHPKKPPSYKTSDPRGYIYSGWVHEVLTGIRTVLRDDEQ